MIPTILLACSLTENETTPSPEPIPEAPISAEVTAEARAAAWVDTRYPGIPAAGFTVDCEPAGCAVHIPERDATHYLTCSEGGCTETEQDEPVKPAEEE